MSVKEKRILEPYEHVDHIDDNRLNDNIDNLQILSLPENNRKEAKRRGKRMVKLKCPNCGKIFIKQRGKTFLSKGGNFTACSRSCSGRFGTLFYNNPNDQNLIKKMSENIICEYVEH